MPKKLDLAKRRRIMQRSMKLGHCVCDPKRPCPCDVFTEQGICPCAGERPEPVPAGKIKLTELVHNAGCASKIAPTDLEAVLARLPAVDDPAIVSGVPAGDDAGIYALADGVRLVQTVDVFTPCVDDPETFGRICAANCLSDIYAMGGRPRTALSIVGFPSETFDPTIMYHMLKGAMDVLAEADVALIGGHSIKDEEIKLGFAITGTIDGGAVPNDRAQVGDRLVLTKRLGVGVLNFARQIGRSDGDMAAAEASMAALNRAAAEAMVQARAGACTDVTGFGLFGHLITMARHSGVTAQVWADRLPAFGGVLDLLRDEVIPGAIERNREYVAGDISVAEGVDEAWVDLGFDAQTSGGLLIAVGAGRHEQLLADLARRGVEATTVGQIVARSSGQILVTLSGQSAEAAPKIDETVELPHGEPAPEPAPCCAPAGEPAAPEAEEHSPECCADVFDKAAAGGPAGEPNADAAAKAFGEMMRVTAQGGAIDERTKELINFALVVLARCRPCVSFHTKKARKMGISQEELDEAAWCAVAMGGAPVRLFYLEATAGRAKPGS